MSVERTCATCEHWQRCQDTRYGSCDLQASHVDIRLSGTVLATPHYTREDFACPVQRERGANVVFAPYIVIQRDELAQEEVPPC